MVFVEEEKREKKIQNRECVNGPLGKGGVHMQEQEQMLRDQGQQQSRALQTLGLLVVLGIQAQV